MVGARLGPHAIAGLLLAAALLVPVIAATADSATINKTSNGEAAADSLTTGNTSYWTFGGTAIAQKASHSYSESSQGLQITIKATKTGKWVGFYAVSPPTSGGVFHATLSIYNTAIPKNSFNTGLYVQTSSNNIDYVDCVAVVDTTGYYWVVGSATGGPNSASKFTTYYSEAGGPMVRDCTLVTNGQNTLRAYFDGQLVFSSDSLNLQMPAPFNSYLEVETSYSGGSLTGGYADYFAATSGSVIVKDAHLGDSAQIVDSSGGVLAFSTVGADGSASLSVEQYNMPVTGSVQVHNSTGSLVVSTPPGSQIWGGDVYSVTGGTYTGPTPPGSPSGLTATAVSSTQVELAWQAPLSDGGSPITGYQIQRSSDAGATWTSIASNTMSPRTTYSDTTVVAGSNYSYQVSAVNAVGTGPPSNQATVTTPQGPPPTTSTINVATTNSLGQPISGYYTTLWQNGKQLAFCYSPCSFTVNNGQTYQVAVADYGAESFSHWQDGTTNRFYTITAPSTGAIFNLTAYYTP